MRLLSQCSIAVRFKIIYSTLEGRERKSEARTKRVLSEVFKQRAVNDNIFTHSRPCQTFAIESLNSLQNSSNRFIKQLSCSKLESPWWNLSSIENEKTKRSINSIEHRSLISTFPCSRLILVFTFDYSCTNKSLCS